MKKNLDIDNLLNEMQKNMPKRPSEISFRDVWQTFEQRKKEERGQNLLFGSCLCLIILVAVNCSALYRNNNTDKNKMKEMAQEMHLLQNNSIYG